MEGSKELVQDLAKPAPVPPKHAFTPSLHSPEVGIIICSTEGAAELSRGVGEVTCANCTLREQETQDPQLLLSSWEAHAPLLTLCSQL